MKKSVIVFIGLALVILSVLFVLFKPSNPGDTAAKATAKSAEAPPQGAGPTVAAPQVFAFKVSDGARLSGPEIIEVEQGSRVTLRISSNQADELHVHGYDLARELPAGDTVSLSFPAVTSGRFEIELHASHQTLTVLQVQPR